MNRIAQLIFIILSAALGVTFLYSAWTKLFPIQSFEYTMVEFAGLSWSLAAIGARAIIGLEAALGALMLANIYGRGKWVLKSALGLTVIFSIYLVYLWITRGDDVNCGCFGDDIWMSPSASLIKNAAIIVFSSVLIFKHNGLKFKYLNLLSLSVTLIFLVLPFILFALPDQQPTWLKKDKFSPDLTALYNPEKATPPATANLRKGKYILSFFSLQCPHCRMAAHKMHIMKEKNPNLPFFFVVAGKEKNLPAFWKETGAEDIPHTKLKSDEFTAIAGYAWPVIWFINDGEVEASANYISLNQAEIERWLAQ